MTVALIAIACLAGFAVLFALFSNSKAQSALAQLSEKDAAAKNAEGKLGALRQEVGVLKEDLAKKNRSLEEARDFSKRKLRREGMKSEEGVELGEKASSEETLKLKQALGAMELQLKQWNEESEKDKTKTVQTVSQELKNEIAYLNDQLKKLDHENLQLKNNNRKKGASLSQLAPHIESLPQPVVDELARLHRKSEQNEKLHTVVLGKLQMAQERYSDLQKRYFAVCRELALSMGKDAAITDVEARDTAEKAIDSDAPQSPLPPAGEGQGEGGQRQ